MDREAQTFENLVNAFEIGDTGTVEMLANRLARQTAQSPGGLNDVMDSVRAVISAKRATARY